MNTPPLIPTSRREFYHTGRMAAASALAGAALPYVHAAEDNTIRLALIGCGTKQAPAEIGSEKVSEISQRDGVKYIMGDDSWLLIRPSGTEPVLRVYAEGRSQVMVKALLAYGEKVAKSVV